MRYEDHSAGQEQNGSKNQASPLIFLLSSREMITRVILILKATKIHRIFKIKDIYP